VVPRTRESRGRSSSLRSQLSGNLVGLDGPEGIQDKPELFDLPIHGSGIAVVELDVVTSNAPFRYVFPSVTYDITQFTLPKKL
jgi:hypothetical protein